MGNQAAISSEPVMIGNILRSRLTSLGEDVDRGCGYCKRILNEMNSWGVKGCAGKHRRRWIEAFLEARFPKIKIKYSSASELFNEVLMSADYKDSPPTNETVKIHQSTRVIVQPTKSIKWAYGVTTVYGTPDNVPERIDDQLPSTLNSLSDAGFGNPRLFVDGGTEEQYKHFGLQVTTRNPKVRAYANWYMSLLELFMRNPDAQRFAIFQDDIKCVRNLRHYLDQLPFPQKGYLNLTTFWESEAIIGNQTPIGIAPAAPQRLNNGQPKRPNSLGVIPQHGRGALGLVFDREGVLVLLRHPHMTNRVMPDKQGHIPDRAYRMIDGAVIEAMNNAGYTEYVHNPSLVQHAGTTSTITGRKWGAKAISKSFPGEQFDCLSLLATEQPVSV